MNSKSEEDGARPCWFVGATYGDDDQTHRFLEEGIWENGHENKYLDTVKSIQAGDLIAIKAAYKKIYNLPFDNRGHTVSVMAIKAIGTVMENFGDGRTLKVNWKPVSPRREWYFFTHRHTVWRVLPDEWRRDALIRFTFEEKEQDIDRFRNHPYWSERFGDRAAGDHRFKWTLFYEAVADKLLTFKNRRDELMNGIHNIASSVSGLSKIQDQFADGSSGPLKDICPFTTMGLFNRGHTDANRKAIAKELANLLEVSEPVPDSFEGIPVLTHLNAWFFGFDKDRKVDDIDTLWAVFSQALTFADSNDAETQAAFVSAYDKAMKCHGVKWNLTMGLYWIRPWEFMSLDGKSQYYIAKELNIQIEKNGPNNCCNSTDYLTLLNTLEENFQEETYPVHSFPELSIAAWNFKENGAQPEPLPPVVLPESYSIKNILEDGCFIARNKLDKILECLRTKKNLILQGPPGTGKTWLAKRLAFALMGQRDESKVRAVQFHPNLSYEDFIRGWRPAGDGKLALVDGPFVEMIKDASKDETSSHVVVIEEINRGIPAQIFGEMLTLLEVDKRTPNEALELTYKRSDGERVFIPNNLYVIGTMNIADRSLALVDLALRRRFAFIDLEPVLGEPWRDWVQSQFSIDAEILVKIEERLIALNSEISTDAGLGPQYRIGHSYVTPPSGSHINNAKAWFHQVVHTEIGPLLDEYWFDALDKSRKARERLLEGF